MAAAGGRDATTLARGEAKGNFFFSDLVGAPLVVLKRHAAEPAEVIFNLVVCETDPKVPADGRGEGVNMLARHATVYTTAETKYDKTDAAYLRLPARLARTRLSTKYRSAPDAIDVVWAFC